MVYECRHILPFTPWYQYAYSQYSSLHKSKGADKENLFNNQELHNSW